MSHDSQQMELWNRRFLNYICDFRSNCDRKLKMQLNCRLILKKSFYIHTLSFDLLFDEDSKLERDAKNEFKAWCARNNFFLNL